MELMHELLKALHASHERMEDDIKQMRREMREGFASIKSHVSGVVGDVSSHERRILNLEDEVMRLKSQVEHDSKPDAWLLMDRTASGIAL